jgi:2-amino-4-hydroxy-6-hydroxymethyldihydropteridine diphosphokinase
MSQVYLSLGTNLGDRRLSLQRAVKGLERELWVTEVSPVYETEPWGVKNQPDFLNICVAADTTKSPSTLLAFTKELEAALGRLPSIRWGPRIIDIDILYYDQLILSNGRLRIPHPRLAERAFVLVPLGDIAPDLVDPKSGLSVKQMLLAVDKSGVRRSCEPLCDWRT